MRSSLASFALALFMVGCGGVSFPRPTLPYEDADALLRSHAQSRAQVVTLRAEARVEQRGEGGRLRGTVMMFVERPSSVRFDVMTQFGPAAILTSHGAQFRLLDLRENRFLQGRTCPSNLAKLLGVSLSSEQMVGVLFGAAPEVPVSSRSVTVGGDGLYHVVEQLEGGGRQELDLTIRESDRDVAPELQVLSIVRVERFGPNGERLFRVDYEGRTERSTGGATGERVSFPDVVSFEDFQRDRTVRIRFVSMDINLEVPEGAFLQEPPPGVTAEEAACELGE